MSNKNSLARYAAGAGSFILIAAGVVAAGLGQLYSPGLWDAVFLFAAALAFHFRVSPASANPVLRAVVLAAIFGGSYASLLNGPYSDISSIFYMPIAISLAATGLLSFVPGFFLRAPADRTQDVATPAPRASVAGAVLGFVLQYLAFAAPFLAMGYWLTVTTYDADYQGHWWHVAALGLGAALLGAAFEMVRFGLMEKRHGLTRPAGYYPAAVAILLVGYGLLFNFVQNKLYSDLGQTFYNIGESLLRTGVLAFLPGLLLGSKRPGA